MTGLRFSIVAVALFSLCIFNSSARAATLADNGNGTVTDSGTGLVWQQGEPDYMAWGNALNYCEGLSLGGANDWRLPNVKELESLTDDALYSPAIDTTYFPNAISSGYWSSTTHAYNPGLAWYVYFYDGDVGSGDKGAAVGVKCVRSGQSGSLSSLSIFASPASLSFGQTDISTPSASQAVSITNTGTTAATLGTTALGGSNPGDFSIMSDSCSSQTIAVGANCTVSVRFNPALAGSKSATLTINDAAQKSAASVSLSGMGMINQPTLVILKSGAGSGTVTSDPVGVTCGATCSAAFSDSTMVNLTAVVADGSTFLGWSGGGCSGTNGCSVALDYATSHSTTVTANFGTAAPACQQQIDDIVIKGTTCTQLSNYAEYSGAISISHATNPNNPVLKIDNGMINVDALNKRITTPVFTSSALYISKVMGVGDVVLGKNYSFDINGSKLKSTSGQGIVAKLLKKLLIDVEIKQITIGADEALIEGKLALPDLIVKMLKSKTGLPLDIGFSSLLFSQSKGFYPGGTNISISDLELEGTPITIDDLKIDLDYIKEDITIEGVVSIKNIAKSDPTTPERKISGKITFAEGSYQGFYLSVDNLNIPVGTSPFYFQKIGGGLSGIAKPPQILSLTTSFSGGPKLNFGDWIGNYQTLCFNNVGVEIDPSSYFKHTGGAGVLCFDSWEQAKNGAIAAQLDGEYNWKTASFKEKGTLTFPYDVLKGTSNLSVTPQDFTGSIVGQLCAPKGWGCFAETSHVINKKGFGGNSRFLLKDLAYFVDWGIAKASWDKVMDHIQIGTNLNVLMSKVKMSAVQQFGKSSAMVNAVADTLSVPAGLDFAIIRAIWQTGTSDLTLTAPDGTTIDPAYAAANPDTVMYMKLDNEAWYALENPAAGAWQADLTNLESLGTVTVSVNSLNAPPSVAITSPATRVTSSTTVDISYTAADPDSQPTITLYYDTDNSGGAGAKIVEGLPMPSGTGTYSWDVSSVPAGIYYLYAVIDDGKNTPVTKYAAGTVEVVTLGAPTAPSNLTAQANGTSMDISWSSVAGAAGYRIYYTDAPEVEMYPSHIALPAGSISYSIANLKPSTTYRVTVTAYDADGAESRMATPATITTAAFPVPLMTVSMDTLDFGTVLMGQSQLKSITISNSGNADMTVSKADLFGSLASSCAVSGITFPVTIASDTNATFDVTFTPLQSGALNSTLQLNSNDPTAPKKSVLLTAKVPFSSYTVTPIAGTGGGMTPSTPQAVTTNSATAFTIAPSPGYVTQTVSGCGGTLTGVTFTTGVVTAACDVTATFAVNPIRINSAAASTSNPLATLTLTYAGASPVTTTMQFLIDNSASWTKLEPFASSKSIKLPSGTGLKTVSVRFVTAGSPSPIYSASIFLDTVAPTGSISIENGAGYTTSTTLNLNLTANDSGNGQIQMRFSEDGKSWLEDWAEFSPTASYTLGTHPVRVTTVNGPQKVYVQFKDSNGKLSKNYFDTITFTSQIPTGDNSQVTINGGATYTTSTAVSLAFIVTGGEQYVHLSNDGTTWGKWLPLASASNWKLSSSDGVKTVYAQFSADQQTASSTYRGTIILDTVAPTGWLLINDGASVAGSTTVNLTMGANDVNGVAKMCLKETSAACGDVEFEDYATSKDNHTFQNLLDGKKTLYVSYQDNAGKVSKPIKASIILDTTSPTGSILINGGKPITTSATVVLKFKASKAVYTQLSMDGGAIWGEWEAFVPARSIALSPEKGTKTFKVKYKDFAEHESPEYSATITLL